MKLYFLEDRGINIPLYLFKALPFVCAGIIIYLNETIPKVRFI